MTYFVKKWLLCILLLLCVPVFAANLSDIQVSNGDRQARITFNFADDPDYAFVQQGPRSVVLDIKQSAIIKGLPLVFSGENLVKSIRAGTPPDKQSLRLVVDLTKNGKPRAVKQKHGAGYQMVFILNASTPPPSSPSVQRNTALPETQVAPRRAAPAQPIKNPFNTGNHATGIASSNTLTHPAARVTPALGNGRIVVAVDAGHGGQDPGAIGPAGTREKDVTIAIARKLRTLLNADPIFKGVLTRDGDYFISVMGRSDVARKQNANLLVSIHADAAPNRDVTGASVWVLSNRRANNEMASWLEQHEKQSELLGGAGDMLANNQSDRYLSQAVLDLQFGHSQRVGYDVAVFVLNELQRVGSLHKRRPEHASLGVLRSPDIPSLLVETGFISNVEEERLLASDAYQQKIARAIYKGLRNYFLAHPLQSAPGA